jgi:hypothetical protein
MASHTNMGASYGRHSSRIASKGTDSSGKAHLHPINPRDYAISASSDDVITLASSRRPFQEPKTPPDLLSMNTAHSILSTSPPRSLVVTGLERVGLPAQRSLLQTLIDGRIELDEEMYEEDGQGPGEVGVWPLPSDFLLVYVCESDPRERPAVHKGLVSAHDIRLVCRLTTRRSTRLRSLRKFTLRPALTLDLNCGTFTRIAQHQEDL